MAEEEKKEKKSVEEVEKNDNSNWKKTLRLYLSLFLIFVLVSLGLTAYFSRDAIIDEVCEVDFTRVMYEDALSLGDCSEVQAEEDDENNQDDQTYSIREGNSEELIESIEDVSDIYEIANPAVAGIGVVTRGGATDELIGSGFVVSEDGLIATNQHVVSDPDAEYFVKLPERTEVLVVEEIYRDAVNDIAVLKVDGENLPTLALASEEDVTPGQAVVAIGNPLGELNSTVTSGIISGVNRTVELGTGTFLRTQTKIFEGTLQTDAAINPGNSGGPLLNSRAEVIGVNFATISGADNLSFALPVSVLQVRLSELNEFGRFRIPYIGILYSQQLVRFGNEVFAGAVIGELDPNGSAAEVLEEGDIIIKVEDKTLEEQALADLIQRQDIGEFIEFEVIRDNERVIELVEVIEREEVEEL